ncbi:SDH family Clp fold serine proteinase [Geoglobus acetivorans]
MYDPLSIIWFLLFFYLLFAPQMRQQMLFNTRRKVLQKLAEKRGSNVITLIHRQESVGFLGIPIYRYIDIDDSEKVLRAIRSTPKDKPIDLIIHTPGGLVLAATQIARAIHEHPAKTTVIVPHYAMSGGTLIALAADEIIMDPHAVLGPVDPQLMNYPAPSILKVLEKKDVKDIDDQTVIMADIAEKAINQVRDLVFSLLKDKVGDKKAEEIARILTEGKWTHDYPLTYRVVEEFGLNVSTDVPEEVYELMDLYSQPIMQRHPGVEFVPSHGDRGKAGR